MLDLAAGVPFSRLLQVRPHHLRSIQIERDYADPGSSLHYVVTPFVQGTVERLSHSLAAGSTARAWRLTGDYGSGKSSFALAFARLAAGQTEALPAELRPLVRDMRLEPVLVVGEREPIGQSVMRAALATATRRLGELPMDLTARLKKGDITPRAVMTTLNLLGDALRRAGAADGLLVVLEELGKNLEFGAHHAGSDDVYLLQHLAEGAARSGAKPIVAVAILHQAVAAYAAALPSAERREWEKVAGRYEEVVFAPPLEQTAVLVAAALDVDDAALPATFKHNAEATMASAIRLGWYGPGAAETSLVALAPGLVPLDPLVLPVLGRLLRRFGQNERSLFGFLSSTEPFGLMAHAATPIDRIAPYRLSDLYDYVVANLTSVIDAGAHATRWSVVDSVVRSSAVSGELDLRVLKTIGLLNLLDDPTLPATPPVVILAEGGVDSAREIEAHDAIQRLSEGGRLIYNRGHAGGLCLWPHTSVDLDEAFAEAVRALGPTAGVAHAVSELLSTAPLVARRHYVETGALRHFEPNFTSPAEFEAVLRSPIREGSHSPDGRVVVVLCETPADQAQVIERVARLSASLDATTLVGIPEPVGGLAPLLRDVRAWSWVRDHTPALAGDRLARDEVARQLTLAQDRLGRALTALVDLRGGDPLAVRWYHRGTHLPIDSGRALTAQISTICDDVFGKSPKIKNELINRRSLSSAAARARSILIEGLATAVDQPRLGLPDEGTPPEMAIYLSVLKAGCVHIERAGRWVIDIPAADRDPLRLRPALLGIGDQLKKASGKRVGYSELASHLRVNFGVREGLIPLLLAIYLAARSQHTAVYEEGTYLDQVGGPEFTRIVKEPEHFEFQHCAIEGVRATVFTSLAGVLGVSTSRTLDVLDIVRPLLQFIARLPDHARRSRQLTPTTLALRAALLDARDPTQLLFEDLPRAYGLDPIIEGAPLDGEVVAGFVRSLGQAIGELRDAYPALLDRIAAALGAALEADGPLDTMRTVIATRAERLTAHVSEPDLKAFLLRLADCGLDDRAWLESVASLVAKKPPERWADPDETEYNYRLPLLASRARRVEAMRFDTDGGEPGFRLVVTGSDGREVEEILRPTASEANDLAELEATFAALFAKHGRKAALAAARALLQTRRDDPA